MATLVQNLAVALIYFLSAKAVAPLSLVESGSVFAIWPPTGVALSALLLYRYKISFGIFLGAFWLNTTLSPPLIAFEIAIGNTLGPIIGAYILFKFLSEINIFKNRINMYTFFISIFIASLITSINGSLVLFLNSLIPLEALFIVWFTWFLGDFIGFLIITSFIIAIKYENIKQLSKTQIIHIITISIMFIITTLLILNKISILNIRDFPIEYLLIPTLLWATLSFRAVGAGVTLILTSIVTILGTVFKYGPFLREDINESLILLQSYIGILGFIVLVIATILKESDDIKELLKEANRDLEKRVEEELSKRREQEAILIQQSRLATMGEMISNIAHQWRQPLNAISLIIQNFKYKYRRGELDEEFINVSVDKAKKIVKKMSTTIDDFRNFFRPNKQKEIFKLSTVIDDTLYLLDASFKHHQIEVELNLDKSIEINGYPNELSQVILNILNNAKDAILKQKINGKISISSIKYKDYIKLEISDNGGGIPLEIIEKIFNPYFSTKESGTGIGLYMSKIIIENNMNGEFKVENINDGASFTIILREY